ncbi:hypothetical protein [Desulfothermus naphthae]
MDLPIQRERHTGYSIVHASGVKGDIENIFAIFINTKNRIIGWKYL